MEPMHILAAYSADKARRAVTHSALPDAPVLPYRPPRRPRRATGGRARLGLLARRLRS